MRIYVLFGKGGLVWNQVSKITLESFVRKLFWILLSGIRCPELILESHVLESGVQNWFGYDMSWDKMYWNQMSGIGTIVKCQAITCL